MPSENKYNLGASSISASSTRPFQSSASSRAMVSFEASSAGSSATNEFRMLSLIFSSSSLEGERLRFDKMLSNLLRKRKLASVDVGDRR